MMMDKEPAHLVLSDGSVYEGYGIGASGCSVGELVFNTSMIGYQEILSDPSYAEQIVTFTTAHVGNTGCNLDDMESTRVWASGVIVRHGSSLFSSYRGSISFSAWLKKQGTIAIAGIDTRALVQRLRDEGSILGCIGSGSDYTIEALQAKLSAFSGLTGKNLAEEVSRQTVECWYEGRGMWGQGSEPLRFHVVVYDFGVKESILRILYDKGCHITIVPAKTSADDVLAMNPDGVVLSNGPGDPRACHHAIFATQKFLEEGMPLLGVCLGFQILGLACGAHVSKMKFGHHGGNHPVVETTGRKRVFITAQNHGFQIDEATLPACLNITHRSLFDQSLQGIIHTKKPAFGFQGHPEASPGPHDIESIFDGFINVMHHSKIKELV